jgi:3',5'-cyclic AMP phosphodiesterase CpdA
MRVAHLSDPHLLSLAGARLRDFLSKRWIGAVNLLTNRAREHKAEVFDALVADVNAGAVDHVLCTGDITNVALRGEFAFASERFARFRHGAAHTTVIPGNHDLYVAAGGGLFDEAFGAYCTSDPGWSWPGGERWPMVRVRGGVAIVGVMTALRTPWFTAWGRLGDDQLRRLHAALTDERLAGLARVVAIHHPPAGKHARHRRHGLKDHAAFCAVLAQTGADLVVHGHEHEHLVNETPGPDGRAIPIRGITSASYAGSRASLRAAYRIYTIEGAGALPREELRVYDPGRRAFAPASIR